MGHIWQWLASNPLVGIASLVAIITGILTIAERLWKAGVSILTTFTNRRHEKRVFALIKNADNPDELRGVHELAEAAKLSPGQTHEALMRLERKQKVRRVESGEVGGLWCLHEFEDERLA